MAKDDSLGANVRRALDRVTRPPVLMIFAALQAAIILTLAAAHLAVPREPGAEHPHTGDYLAFHVGATLVREGRGEDLYDFNAQRTVQETLLDGPRDWQQRYLNPPGLAIALAPVTALGYVPAFLLFTLAMVSCLAGAVALGSRVLPRLRTKRWGGATAALLAAGYLPVALTMFGGQNTVLTLFLLMATFWALRERRSATAGLFVGLLAYKPQFALLPALLLVARRDGWAVATAIAVGLAHYVVGAATVGWDWPLEMISALHAHGPLEVSVRHFSVTGVLRHLLPGTAATVLSVMLAAGAAVIVWKGGEVDPADERFPAFFAFVILAGMAISPHLQYYDAGLLVLAGILILETRLTHGSPPLPERAALAVAYLCYPAWQFGDVIGMQPLVLLLLALLLWAAVLSFSGNPRHRSRQTHDKHVTASG